jgi:hypothetical protein
MSKVSNNKSRRRRFGQWLSDIPWHLYYVLAVLFRALIGQTIRTHRRNGRQNVLIALADGQSEKLTSAGIPFVSWPKGEGKNAGSIAVARKDQLRALAALGLYEVTALPQASSSGMPALITRPLTSRADDIARLSIIGNIKIGIRDKVQGLRPSRLTADHPLRRAQQEIALAHLIAERLRPIFPGAIAVHLDGAQNFGLDADKLHVFIRGVLLPRSWAPPTNQLCGVQVCFHFKDSPNDTPFRGVVCTEPTNHHPIAELNDNYLNIFAGLNTAKNEAEALHLFDRILKEIVEQLDCQRLARAAISQILAIEGKDALQEGLKQSDLPIVQQGFSGRKQELTRALVAGMLGPVLGDKAILLNHADKTPQPPVLGDGKFHIFYDAFRLNEATGKAPDTCWGWPVPPRQLTYHPSGQGRLIVNDSGFPLAELDGDNLYIFFSMIESGSRQEAMLFARFLSEVRSLLKYMQQPELSTADCATFVQNALYQISLVQSAATKNTADTRALVRATSEKLTRELTRELQQARKSQRAWYGLADIPNLNSQLGVEFDQMLQISKVEDVKVTNTALIVLTKVIFCRDPRTGKIHEIGAFEITFPFDTGKTIVWLNKTRLVKAEEEGFNAPHVNPKGHACLGNTKDSFAKLRANREFATALQLAIAFLESVDTTDGWGKYIDNWPLAHGVQPLSQGTGS